MKFEKASSGLKRVAESRVVRNFGFLGGLVYSWSPANEWVMGNVAKSTYHTVGGLLGVLAAGVATGAVSFAQQYPSARCANSVFDSDGKLISWARNRFGPSDNDDKGYEPKTPLDRATSAFLLGTDFVTLNERRRGATHDHGKDLARSTAKSLGIMVAAIAGITAGGSELAKVFGDEVLADNIVAVASSWKTWGTVFVGQRLLSVLGNRSSTEPNVYQQDSISSVDYSHPTDPSSE